MKVHRIKLSLYNVRILGTENHPPRYGSSVYSLVRDGDRINIKPVCCGGYGYPNLYPLQFFFSERDFFQHIRQLKLSDPNLKVEFNPKKEWHEKAD